MTEKQLEQKLKKEIEKLGGKCLKLQTPGFTGIPDRLVILPGGKVWFVEVKDFCGMLSKRQELVISELRSLGHSVKVLYMQESLDNLLKAIQYDL